MFDGITIERPGPPLTEEALDAFERRSGRRLPASFRTYLVWRNGGTPVRDGWPEDVFPCVRLHWPKDLRATNLATNVDFIWRFDDDPSDFKNIHFLLANYAEIPEHITPIARDSGNWIFFFDMREGPEPAVRYGAFLEPERAALVAGRFADFFDAILHDLEV